MADENGISEKKLNAILDRLVSGKAPEEIMGRLATILPPPRIHRHAYQGVFAPNAPLRPLVTALAQEDNAVTAQAPGPPLLLPTPPTAPAPQPEGAEARTPDTTPSRPPRWAALLASGHRREALVVKSSR